MVSSRHQYQLESYRGQRSRHTCPHCHRPKEFTRYIDTGTAQPLADHVGKCNRESKCGYHYTPREYFRDHPLGRDPGAWRQSNLWQTCYRPPQEQPIEYIPQAFLEKSCRNYERNNFVRYLIRLFGPGKALQLARQFHLGTSKHWQNEDGLAVVFWQVDRFGKVRQAKVMAYHPGNGRRLKAEDEAYKFSRKNQGYYPDRGKGAKVFFAGKSLLGKSAHLQQCFFGEHQLADHPESPVAIVESEKTAVIMSGIFPKVIWLATGGTNGARWTDRHVYHCLEGRGVVLYPDLGAYQQWAEKAKILATVCVVSVSDLLEQKATPADQEAGFDLADFFVKKIINGGPGGRQNGDSVTPLNGAKGRRKNGVQMDQEMVDSEVLPPGCFWETGKDRFGRDYRVMVDGDGVPVGW